MGGNGKDFEADHEIKGCHAESGFAYYGTYEHSALEHRKSVSPPFYRPNGYDCGIILNKNHSKANFLNEQTLLW